MWEDLSAREMIQAITSEWFLMEPIMFEVYCKHQLKANDTIKVPIRSGKGLIEYNGEQYMVHNILLHNKAKVGEYFDAVLVTDLYSDGSVRQQIRFDLGGNHEDK